MADDGPIVTKSGRVLTDEDVERMAEDECFASQIDGRPCDVHPLPPLWERGYRMGVRNERFFASKPKPREENQDGEKHHQ